MSDKYDKAVAYLTRHPGQIETTWGRALCSDYELDDDDKEAHKKAACLFTRCGDEDGKFQATGCLTQISHGAGVCAGTPELTKAIKADQRIPQNGEDIEVGDLSLFAEWRRRIDKEIAKAKRK